MNPRPPAPKASWSRFRWCCPVLRSAGKAQLSRGVRGQHGRRQHSATRAGARRIDTFLIHRGERDRAVGAPIEARGHPPVVGSGAVPRVHPPPAVDVRWRGVRDDIADGQATEGMAPRHDSRDFADTWCCGWPVSTSVRGVRLRLVSRFRPTFPRTRAVTCDECLTAEAQLR